MDIRYIAIAFLYFAAIATCSDHEEESSITPVVQAMENVTNLTKVIEKRNSIPLVPTNPDGSLQENGIGLKSIAIQVMAGVLKGFLGAQGISSEQVDQAINLFNPDKIYNDLQLVRRGLNIFLRLLRVLMNFFPSSSAGFSLNPLKSLASKVSFYAVSPTLISTHALAPNNGSSFQLPERIQSIVDFVSQIPIASASSGSEEDSVASVAVDSGSESLNEADFLTEAPAVVEVPTTTPAPTTTLAPTTTPAPTTTLAPVTTPVAIDDRNGIVQANKVVVPLPVYGLPATNPKNLTNELPSVDSSNRFNDAVPQPTLEQLYRLLPYLAVARRLRTASGDSTPPLSLPQIARALRILNNEVDPETNELERHATKKADVSSIADLPLENSLVDRSNSSLRDSFGALVNGN